MNRIEHSVRLGWTIKGEGEDYGGRLLTQHGYYEGRDQHGQIKIGKSPNAAAMMTEEVAQELVAKLKEKYPLSEVTELICNERDELTATSLAELGEAEGATASVPEGKLPTSIDALQRAIRKCLGEGFSRKVILMQAINVEL
jgi:hypothetical protein